MKIIPPPPISLGLWVLGGFALLGAGCDKRELSVEHPPTAADTFALTADWPAFAQNPTRKLDLLFMVDDSPSMGPQQAKLAAGFSQFMSSLEALPGGVPDLHIGVVSSSMGAGRSTGVQQCPPGGDHGALQNTPLGPRCGAGPSDAYLAVRTDPGTGATVTNFGDQSLSDVFGCIALLGQGGCGFEHQLSSVRHALDPALAPAVNAGFLRSDAFLAVILITDEDDCSAPDDSDLFDTSSVVVSDPLGPMQSYRCNEFGHLCLIDGKLQHPPRTTATGELQGCRSNEDGKLDRVSDFVTFLGNLKKDPARVFLAAVTGPATPYVVGLGPSQVQDDPHMWPYIAHSCTATDGTYADPAVRIAQAVGAFGSHGLLSSICGDTMGPVLHEISTRLSQPMAASCVPTPSATGPGCTVVDRSVDDQGNRAAARLPSCADDGDVPPCWRLTDDVASCGAGAERLVVDRDMSAVPADLVTAIDCTAAHP